MDKAGWRGVEAADFPFTDADFLEALEGSGPATRKGGWEPTPIELREGGQLLAAMPAYVKAHSYGEYIFDWDWARAYREHGHQYYPKLVSMVPCTPATGPHLLTAAGAADRRGALVDGLVALHAARGTSSAHALFLEPDELPLFVERGFLARKTLQFHWQNRGYRDFADYLEAFVGKRRRQIVRERRQVADQGLVIRRRTGAELTAADGRLMHGFYRATVDRKEGLAYLPEAFFVEVFARMPGRVLLVTAEDAAGIVVGASVSFYKGKHLYGRYWGATGDYRSLHFELCYYQTIEFALERGMTRVEAGAQGPHKIARGFLPSVVHSAHLIREPAFRGAIARYLDEEARALEETIAGFEGSPFVGD